MPSRLPFLQRGTANDDQVGQWTRAQLEAMDRRFSNAMARCFGMPELPSVEFELECARRDRKRQRRREPEQQQRAAPRPDPVSSVRSAAGSAKG